MSPQIAIFKPSIFFFLLIIVNASSNAWVGCSWVPSPALIIQAEHSNERERKFPENIEKPGEGLVRSQNVIRSVKEIKDGLLEEAVGITSMEVEETKEEL